MAADSRIVLLIGVAALSTLGGGASQGGEILKRAPKQHASISNQGSPAALSETAITAIFDRRWSSPESDFVLGADGVVLSEPAAKKAAMTSNHIGNTSSAQRAKEDKSVDADLVRSATGAISHNGIIVPDKQDTENVRQCGPSPLSASETKTLVVESARRHKVDEVFATAIAWAESGFDRIRNSEKGARGPMQLIPATAAQFGVRDVCDPAENIEGGMKYLRVLLDEFQNPLLVAAAYNAGERRIYEYGGIPPFRETVGYVAKVVNYQLGLPMPATTGKSPADASEAIADAGDDRDVGVIAVKKTGRFVGGVMHF
ncbi:lytic transglycosylase domain-containing protein [Mesorhizobium onobrychidis]|uniref:Lytic transglycosylase domain-containing protein n=1 Tax=Mesorhizobium onobrychidis TaxID=2775404 RepID=A0ABY5R7L2_9HYPH|nr:lytic transglycosylase domain-containing protein [Mesorhizobium onobrychidis]UVC19318.1 lytic transglycosylase domain-containing protein [Mesorhizobium onobrychidis]